MRPVRLELEGFTSFREPTAVTFENTELFVLTGPTGSGKSSLIDAMIFALYGCVPRYDDRRLVAPVISQGKVEAKVRFDFAVDGKVYTAVRVVRRTGTGATTKEARLEVEGRVVAGNEKDLTAEIEQNVIRLSFDHFTKCVVLPQGEFAEFLRTKPADRQDVLVRLLDLDLFARIGQRANQLAAEYRNKADLLQGRLDEELADATEDALKKSMERVRSLEALKAMIDADGPKLDEIHSAIKDAEKQRKEADENLEVLDKIKVPKGVAELSERYKTAVDALAKAEDRYSKARHSKEKAEGARDLLPERTQLEGYEQLYHHRRELDVKISPGESELTDLVNALNDHIKSETKAYENLKAATNNLGALKQAHTAADLARHLEEGEPCPVCLRVVESLPEHETPVGFSHAESALIKAEAEWEACRKNREKKQQQVTAAEAKLDGLKDQLNSVAERLQEAPSPDELKELLEKVEAAETTLKKAGHAEKQAHDDQMQRQKELKDIEKERSEAWLAFDRARDGVARLQPPEPNRDDLHASWIDVSKWAVKKAKNEREIAEDATESTVRYSARRDKIIEDQRSACAEAGLDTLDRQPSAVCIEALIRTQKECEDLGRKAEIRMQVIEKKKEALRNADVAARLGRHLSATGFERWLLNRALRRLVAGATGILKELSDGAYSLGLTDDNNFEVIDHRNADERRSAKTLSGGETFLASLSLALALAEQVGQLAARGSAKLEALFLDEGFGTLDSETLDTVTAAIQELGSTGRMVGIVTHVRELAEAIPVQYRVKKIGNVSSVERVAA